MGCSNNGKIDRQHVKWNVGEAVAISCEGRNDKFGNRDGIFLFFLLGEAKLFLSDKAVLHLQKSHLTTPP